MISRSVQLSQLQNLDDGEDIEDQNVEFGTWQPSGPNGSLVLAPLDVSAWRRRQAAILRRQLDTERPAARRMVAEVEADTRLHEVRSSHQVMSRC